MIDDSVKLSIEYRRLRGDMIEVFKIINNMYSTASVAVLPFAPTSSVTSGNSFKLLNQRFYHDIRKYSFLPRIINTWNSLPDFIVNVDFINIFKNRLDTFWSDQEIIFDLQLILSESEIYLSL